MADITTDQRFASVTLAITNARGDPASVDGVPVWSSSDITVLTVVPGVDGLTAVVDTVAPGIARISVTADADLGEGVETITGVSEDVNVTLGASSKASVLALILGAPTSK